MCNIPILFYPIIYVATIHGPLSLSPGLARFVPIRNLQLVGLKGVAVLWFVGHHFLAVGTNSCQGTFLSAAATATAAVLGHGREEVSVLFLDEIKLFALGFKFRA